MPLQKMEINFLISMMAVFLAHLSGSSETVEDSVRPYMEEGGWATFPGDLLARPGPCNIAIRDSRLTQAEFMSEFATSQPLVVRDVSNNDLFRALSRKKSLLRDYGHTSITLSAANTHSYEKKVVTFKDYCEKYTGPQRLLTPANETFYMFGDHDYLEWGDLFAEYSPPPYNLPRHKPAFSFGVAGPGSGVPFHFHGPGWAEAIHGRKRWFLSPPHQQPTFHPNKTTLQWFLEDYPTEKVTKEDLQFNKSNFSSSGSTARMYHPARRGDFLPRRMVESASKLSFVNSCHFSRWHATLNIDTAVFISTFLSP